MEDQFHLGYDNWLILVPGFTPSTFGFDAMHCGELGPSGTAVANVFFDLTKKEFAGTKGARVAKLNEEIKAAYDELRIRHFSDAKAPYKQCP